MVTGLPRTRASTRLIQAAVIAGLDDKGHAPGLDESVTLTRKPLQHEPFTSEESRH